MVLKLLAQLCLLTPGELAGMQRFGEPLLHDHAGLEVGERRC
ncbi:MAG: hypothetical protein U1E76_05110 [Planctomycetota bacterium]